eukprot:2870147-Amphidinium_carterae.1
MHHAANVQGYNLSGKWQCIPNLVLDLMKPMLKLASHSPRHHAISSCHEHDIDSANTKLCSTCAPDHVFQ